MSFLKVHGISEKKSEEKMSISEQLKLSLMTKLC